MVYHVQPNKKRRVIADCLVNRLVLQSVNLKIWNLCFFFSHFLQSLSQQIRISLITFIWPRVTKSSRLSRANSTAFQPERRLPNPSPCFAVCALRRHLNLSETIWNTRTHSAGCVLWQPIVISILSSNNFLVKFILAASAFVQSIRRNRRTPPPESQNSSTSHTFGAYL